MQKLLFIVDDNDANLTVAASALENEYRVLTMPSAAKMFSLLAKKRPDLILLDVEMPDMDGLEAIAKLKASDEWKDIPVAFLTGRSDPGFREEAMKTGVLGVINKPIDSRLLCRDVKEYI